MLTAWWLYVTKNNFIYRDNWKSFHILNIRVKRSFLPEQTLEHLDVVQTIMDDEYFNFAHQMDLKLEDFGKPEEAFVTYHGDIAFLRMTFGGAPYAMVFAMGQGPIGIKGTLVDRTGCGPTTF